MSRGIFALHNRAHKAHRATLRIVQHSPHGPMSAVIAEHDQHKLIEIFDDTTMGMLDLVTETKHRLKPIIEYS
jgi:hypothetical protein